MAQNEIAALARRMADMIAGLWDVIKSPNDPEQRADRIRADTTEILCEMADVVSWLEVRDDATAAERLTVRLCFVCDEAEACAALPHGEPRAAILLSNSAKLVKHIRISDVTDYVASLEQRVVALEQQQFQHPVAVSPPRYLNIDPVSSLQLTTCPGRCGHLVSSTGSRTLVAYKTAVRLAKYFTSTKIIRAATVSDWATMCPAALRSFLSIQT